MKQFVKNSLIVFSLSFIAKGLSFIQNLIFVNKVGVCADSDSFYAIFNLIEFLQTFTGLSILQSVATTTFSQELSASKKHFNDFFTSLILIALGASLCISLVPFISPMSILSIAIPGYNPADMHKAAWYLRLGAFSVSFALLSRVFNALLGVKKHFIAQNIFLPLYFLVFIITTVFSQSEAVVENLCFISTLLYAGICIAQYFIMRENNFRLAPAPLGSIQGYGKRFFLLGYPYFLSTSISSLAALVDRMIASYFQKGMITSISISYNLVTVANTLLLIPVWNFLFPHFSRQYFAGQHAELKQNYLKGSLIFAIIFVPLTVFFIVFSQDIITGLYFRKNFTLENVVTTARLLRFYSFSLILQAGTTLPLMLLQSAQKNMPVGVIGMISFGANILLSILLSIFWGPIGIPLGTVLSLLLYTFLLDRSVNTIFNISMIHSIKSALLFCGLFAGISVVAVLGCTPAIVGIQVPQALFFPAVLALKMMVFATSYALLMSIFYSRKILGIFRTPAPNEASAGH
jgi:putative peptidoglycan lipid II flippase